ncbi:MAG: hypothetical protein SF182_02800 [Deltaproteobacteria bacterium]|nr:hypothetical protein [Deltaproteobacteria bacterium]
MRTWLTLAALLIASTAAAAPAGWTALGPQGGRMSAVAFDPTEPSAAYAIGHDAGYRRDHAAAPWRRLIDNVYSLAVGADGTLYFGGDGHVFRSRDRGVTFTTHAIPLDGAVDVLSLDPGDGSLLAVRTLAALDYDGIAAATLLRSTDAAVTWRVVRALPEERIAGVTRDPDHPATIYVGAETSGVLVSRDDGATWETTAIPCAGAPRYTRCVESILAVPGALLVGTFNLGVVRSRDGGAKWDRVSTPAYVAALAAAPQAPELYAAGASTWPGAPGASSAAVVLRSSDGGGSWLPVTSMSPPAPVIALAVDPNEPSQLLAATGSREYFAGDGVYSSADGGTTWRSDRAGLDATCVSDLAAASGDDTVVYAALSQSTLPLQVSSDGGSHWRAATPPMAWPSFPALAIDPRDPHVAYAAAHVDGLFVTRDAGASWSRQPIDRDALSDVAVDAADGALYTVGPSGWLSKSTDGGATFTPLLRGNSVAIQVEVDAGGSGVYALSYDTLHVSHDGGRSWARLLEAHDKPFWNMAIAPTSPPTIYVADGHGVHISRDGGRDWRVRHIVDARRDAVQTWAIDPSNPRTVYAAGFVGAAEIYRTDDAGRSWRRIATRSPFSIAALAVDPHDPRVLYVGTCGGGVQRLLQGTSSGTGADSGGCAVAPPAISAPLLFVHALLAVLFARSARRR